MLAPKKITTFSIMISLLLLFGLAACQNNSPAAATDQPFVTFHDDALGLTLEYPESWLTHTSMSGLTLATSQVIIDSQSMAEIGDDAFVVIIPGEIALFNAQTGQDLTSNEALQALRVYRELLAREGQNFVELAEPQMIEVDGRQVAIWPLESRVEGKVLVVRMGIVMGDDHMALISAASIKAKAEEYEPLFERVISTIQVEAPAMQ
jgi:hypothetical protein